MNRLLIEFIDELERKEVRLLVWGLVDGSFTESEIFDLASDFLDEKEGWDDYHYEEDFIEELVDRALLFSWYEDASGTTKYRSRMAESVRLFARLKQLFPRHLNSTDGWRSAANLVSDFRLVTRPRHYPNRNHEGVEVIEEWSNLDCNLTSLQIGVLKALLNVDGEGEAWKLASFQKRATERILDCSKKNEENDKKEPSGTVVCAGTGSGKTLAFYLPALTHIASLVQKDSSHWVRALAIYPRNELLKDQFSETLEQTRKLKSVFQGEQLRPILIGTFFGPNPNSNRIEDVLDKKWVRYGDDFVCPFLKCPDCSQDLLWKKNDREQNKERLTCSNSDCSSIIEEDEIVLTRSRLKRVQPDILFCTTEMMNQRMTDSKNWELFGIGFYRDIDKKPSLVLIDEVHSYEGSQGAQVAYFFRRWMQRSYVKPHFVGLSATLMEADRFFSELTGVTQNRVEEISPERGEMKKEGVEYMLALRGDPVSGASLLSTSIQSTMLMRRVLDSSSEISGGLYGKKVFVFADDLDVINRMFHNIRDAEGQSSNGTPNPVRLDGSLANLRRSDSVDEEQRFKHGQSWRVSEDIGHNISQGANRMRVGRVSSQDSGVDRSSEVIVATASLEVGFNDKEVGAVIQHKSPRNMASFLQRKGRAGRDRSMRPWTIVVLSDYGRDRISYQGYDLLFDPELKPRQLPLSNRQVMKMQSVFAFLDWCSSKLSAHGHLWKNVSQPADPLEDNWTRNRQLEVAALIEKVMSGEEEYYQLREYLRWSVRKTHSPLSDDELDKLLWQPPRALMTSVIPTLHRRLTSNWKSGNIEGQDYSLFYHPLPEFIPSKLFGSLDISEVNIKVPTGPQLEYEEEFMMGVQQTLREYAPGRISKRHGIHHQLSRHWVPVDPDRGSVQNIDVSSFCNSYEELGVFQWYENQNVNSMRVLRPYEISLSGDPPNIVSDSSSAMPRWRSSINQDDDSISGSVIGVPRPSPWQDIINELSFFTHNKYQSVKICRFSLGSDANIKMRSRTEEIRTNYVISDGDSENAQNPVGLGFQIEVDAIRVRVNIPPDWNFGHSQEKLPSLRVSRFKYLILEDAQLDGIANYFEREFIVEIVLSTLTAIAIESTIDLRTAWEQLISENTEHELTLSSALDIIYETIVTDEIDEPDDNSLEEDGNHNQDSQNSGRVDHLRDLLENNNTVRQVIERNIAVLWEDPDSSWNDWLEDRFLVTVGSAFQQAIHHLCGDSDAEDLLIDIDPGSFSNNEILINEGVRDIWVSEATSGGGGIIELSLPRIIADPRRFIDLLTSALEESDLESADFEVNRLLDKLVKNGDQDLVDSMQDVRNSYDQGVEELSEKFELFQQLLNQKGYNTSHVMISTLASRIIRPGTSVATDSLIYDMNQRWKTEECRLGVEIGARAYAYALSEFDNLDHSLTQLGINPPNSDRRIWRFNSIYSLIWLKGSQARNKELSTYNPFVKLPDPERLLVLDSLVPEKKPIQFGENNWKEQFNQQLTKESRVELFATAEKFDQFKKQLINFLVEPIEVDSIFLFPRIRAVYRKNGDWFVRFEIIAPGQIVSESDVVESSSRRVLLKVREGEVEEVRDLMESLYAVQFIDTKDDLWIVSPWISDIPIIDNSSGNYSGIDSTWPKRKITFSEVLAKLLKKNQKMKITVVTQPVSSNKYFCDRLNDLTEIDGTNDRVKIQKREVLHIKGVTQGSFSFDGSMNYTKNGVEVLEEKVNFDTDRAIVAQFHNDLINHYSNIN